MNLPTQWSEANSAAALAFAREFVAAMKAGDFIGLGFSPFDSETGHAFLRRVLLLGDPA